MLHLRTGQFHGQTNQIIQQDGITLTDTEYTLDKVDWHYHENAYFTFILQGRVIEGNKKEVIHCPAGTLLFHNWQEPHYNIKPKGFTRGFHIEVQNNWLDAMGLSLNNLKGNITIQNPDSKLLLYKIFMETRQHDGSLLVSIEALLGQLFLQLQGDEKVAAGKPPLWVNKLRQILREHQTGNQTLKDLAAILDIHPVHLCRDFKKYFNCNLGTYLRKLKIEKSLSLLPLKNMPLASIAFECGFADQSHFARCFKNIIGANPHTYRKHFYLLIPANVNPVLFS